MADVAPQGANKGVIPQQFALQEWWVFCLNTVLSLSQGADHVFHSSD
jgi:hypothetical protein